jgi:putative toxin-antitoxin system antitoxin component (TIGR02293 family)
MAKRTKTVKKSATYKDGRNPKEMAANVTSPINKVEDPFEDYFHRITIADWLAISSAAAKTITTEFDLIKLGNTGITKNAIHNLAASIGISRKDIAEDIFNISVKTLERKDTKTKLDKKTSSHAVEIARVLQHAYDVFRDKDKVKRWLNSENKALNNLKPVALFDTLSGLTMVNDVLGRIEEGVYS